MAGPRGYHSYRGRGSKGKAVLAAVLVLVILASVGFIMLQKYIVYDETGTPHLMLPEKPPEQTAPEKEEEPVDLKIQAPETRMPARVQALALAEAPLTEWSAAQPEALMASSVNYNAVVLTMKDSAGRVYFDAGTPEAAPFVETEEVTAGALQAALADSRYAAVARLSCFHDPTAANANVETMGLENTGGYIFYDGNNSQWLDPGKPAARQYLCDLAAELAKLGFDEILLTDVSYPTEGKLDKIDYGETMKAQNFLTFLEQMRLALAPYDVTLAIELPAQVIAEGSDPVAGLMLTDIAPEVDRICAPASAGDAASFAAKVSAAGGRAFAAELAAGDGAPSAGSYLHLAR